MVIVMVEVLLSNVRLVLKAPAAVTDVLGRGPGSGLKKGMGTRC